MNRDSHFDHLLETWLDDGAVAAPERFVWAALGEVEHTSQRGAWRTWLEGLTMRLQTAYIPLVLAGVVLALVGFYALVSRPPSVGPPPSPSAQLSRHVTDQFMIPLSLALPDGFEARETAHVVSIFDAASGDAQVDRMILGAAEDIAMLGNGGEERFPADVPGWLSRQPGITSAASEVTIAGRPAQQIDATISGDASRQLLRIGPPDPGAGALLVIPAGDQALRLFVIDAGEGRRLVLVINRAASQMEAWTARTRVVVDSLELDPST
ncbi:MAG: hypothetical protein ACRDHD_00850 [Candidatus Limnocylindria bacterium]